MKTAQYKFLIIIIIIINTPANTYARMSQVFCVSRGSDIYSTSDRQQQQNLIERMNLSNYYYSDLQVVNANLGGTDQHLRVNCFKKIFKSRFSLIVWVNVLLNRTVVVDSD